jgi:mannan endo-1,4-beta-mannosidase
MVATLFSFIPSFGQKKQDIKIIYRNLALGSSISASSVGEGLIARNAIDGDTATRWNSEAKDDEWIILDLKAQYKIDKIVIKWEVAFASDYKIQVSDNGDKWTDVINIKNGDGQNDIHDLPSVKTHFIKLLCIKRGTRFGFSIWEFEVYSFNNVLAIHDAFDNTYLKRWNAGENYSLTNENNILKIIKTGNTANNSFFAFNITENIPLTLYPSLSFKLKCTEQAVMEILPASNNHIADTLCCSLYADNRWHIYSFTFDSSIRNPLKKIIFRIISSSDKNSSTPVFMDDLVVGYQGNIQKTNKVLLEKLIVNAEKLNQYHKTGNQAGQVTTFAKNNFENTINYAREIFSIENIAQNEIDSAIKHLISANADFEESVIKPDLPFSCVVQNATVETQYLYNNLIEIKGKAFFFGQMDPFDSNRDNQGKVFQSDIEDICGSLPALGSWELKDISVGHGFEAITKEVEHYYSRNGIISFCWHMLDPSGRSFYVEELKDKIIATQLLPGGTQYEWLLSQLDNIALFIQQLKGPHGESIPVLFRPYHEMDGGWFWWGKNCLSPDKFAELWQLTFNYLVHTKKIKNILFVFSTSDRIRSVDGDNGYLEFYPGDEYVDVLAHDNYWSLRKPEDSTMFLHQVRITTKLADEKNKITALSETGLKNITISDWFTSVLLNPLKKDSLAFKLSYIALWNRSFVPYPGHPSAMDFLKFYHDPVSLFIGDYPDLYHSVNINFLSDTLKIPDR